MTTSLSPKPPAIWWVIIIFCGTHLAAAYGVYHRPPATVPMPILVATVAHWQLTMICITIGYHRLYSHRSFNASIGVRSVLAVIGAGAFQGSIKVLCLRHRLHHRFTDDEENDPYCATRGFVFSHFGWFFFKPKYPKFHLIEREDLEKDPVVRLQQQYILPIAITLGIIFPTIFGATCGDTVGGFIYGALVGRLLIWHSTFLVNSLAHWDGVQPYSDQNTSRTNLIVALVSAGEGNHNFHSFPDDYRSDPAKSAWDPSKWAILALAKLGFVWGLRYARTEDIAAARAYMLARDHRGAYDKAVEEEWVGPTWTETELEAYVKESDACIVLIDKYAVDVTRYIDIHPGGARLLRNYAFPINPQAGKSDKWKEADKAFNGGMNKHSQAARRCMKQLRVARVLD
ncbi:hypothetical protein BGW80DRAFT_1171928 [Lactifluus volemus]|nr:hypothetical protein BGW80DRAFT_1171928 [Lactifluus volemus]